MIPPNPNEPITPTRQSQREQELEANARALSASMAKVNTLREVMDLCDLAIYRGDVRSSDARALAQEHGSQLPVA